MTLPTGDHLAALILTSALLAILLWRYTAAAWAAVREVHAQAREITAGRDEVDLHFATLPDFLSAPTFTDLRADWGQWEKEVSA